MPQPSLPPSVAGLIDEFSKLPGIGPKSAQRLTFFLLRGSDDHARRLAAALIAVREKVTLCAVCFTMTESNPCPICADPHRDHGVICVVEEPLDVVALERTQGYRGVYHVLHGAISPMEGVGPDDLRIRELIERARVDGVGEVILATNPNLEGDATAMYISRLLAGGSARVTRLARGLPVGGDLEYADEVTLSRALDGRREM